MLALKLEREHLKLKKDGPIVKQKILIIERDIRYYTARIGSAIKTSLQLRDNLTVLFGAKVEVEDEEGKLKVYEIVGEDEANISQGKISYISPLAEALIGAKLNDEVIWRKPFGEGYLIIKEIKY
jgi:transcription elongation GreA/GreB family factor